jgi:hypothetical protein
MATREPNGQEFVVVYSVEVRTALKALAARARQYGLTQEFRYALRAIDRKLHYQPTEFGDPHFQLAHARLTVYMRVFPPLIVSYAVHKHKPVVFVRSFRPFPADAF